MHIVFLKAEHGSNLNWLKFGPLKSSLIAERPFFWKLLALNKKICHSSP
jgi:hypothetical protein